MALAEVFEFDTTADPFETVDAAFGVVVEGLRLLPVQDAVQRGQGFQNRLLGLEAELVAARLAEGMTSRQAEKLSGRGGGMGSVDAKNRTKRAKAVIDRLKAGGPDDARVTAREWLTTI